MSRENTSPLPHGDGEGRCLTSSPVCGSVVERGVARYPGPSVAAFFVPCGSACKQRGGNVPTMVLSETRGLWLGWVVRGGIRWPARLGLLDRLIDGVQYPLATSSRRSLSLRSFCRAPAIAQFLQSRHFQNGPSKWE